MSTSIQIIDFALAAGCWGLLPIMVYIGFMAFVYLVLDHGLRFVRTRRWLRRHTGRVQQVLDAYVEYELTSPSVFIWLPEQKARPDFPEVQAAWRERRRRHYRDHPAFVPAEFFRDHSLPPPPAGSVYTSWRDWSGGVALGLVITTLCVAGFLALMPCPR